VQALTVIPGQQDSADLLDVPEPEADQGPVLVDGLALGICGTDREIVSGGYGEAPPGEERLIVGHESLGRVLEAPEDADLRPGDLVVGIVRRPDPVPCPCCAAGQWDMCRNGRYTERGIKARHGYGSQRWRVEPGFCIRLDPRLERAGVLLEPASILAKAWEQVQAIAERACFRGARVLVTGAGPVGLMATLMATQRGFETDVLDLAKDGPKPELVRALGAGYHPGAMPHELPAPDIVIESTGAPEVVLDSIRAAGPNGIVCLTGLSPAEARRQVDVNALNQELVLENGVVFGSVNANRAHYEQAAEALAAADLDWLEGVVTRRVPLAEWRGAIAPLEHDVKVVLELGS
jgi:threonine dehydrogenase-like Zn-dependent dehydrogenase